MATATGMPASSAKPVRASSGALAAAPRCRLHPANARCTADESKPRKRGRPPKAAKASDSSRSAAPPPSASALAAGPAHPPQLQTDHPHTSPHQTSPSTATPNKAPVLKALPTVRDHTTDQVSREGDEYVPREVDEAGEKKITDTGRLVDDRKYRCHTFPVLHRGEKLFMLATECARVLGYRDSYLLFNKNRSLYKIIANQAEKDDLIDQGILAPSYRSRQIAIVTARSMFRQFGSKVVINGRRVRDDYWEHKARKQGFTEADAASEKRPGAAKREAAAAAAATPTDADLYVATLPRSEIFYEPAGSSPSSHLFAASRSEPATYSVPVLHPPRPRPDDDVLDYGLAMQRPQPEFEHSHLQRPRQEMVGTAYQDRTQPSTAVDFLQQASQAADWNTHMSNQRTLRQTHLNQHWSQPREPSVSSPRAQADHDADPARQPNPALHSPPLPSAAQHGMVAHPPPRSQAMAVQPPYMLQAPNPLVQTPVRPMAQPLRPEQMHHRSSSLSIASTNGHGHGHGSMAGYGYSPTTVWPATPAQPQPSPLAQQHNMQPYSPHPAQSPHMPSPMHAPPQLAHAQSSAAMHPAPLQQYSTMGAIATGGYPAMSRNPYQASPSPQQYMHPGSATQPPGQAGWPSGAPAPQPGWQGY